ncbi:MAG: histidine kinase N-terminal 7TM domain-containing protein [Halobacteriales archaeon]
MVAVEPVALILAIAAGAVAISTIPFGLVAISYRRRDNGLAYLLLVLGIGIWNALFIAQLLSLDPEIQGFFLSLSVVGAVLAGLGFLLFATTASSTANYLSRRSLYAILGLVAGLDIVFAVSAPLHSFYWRVLGGGLSTITFSQIEPGLGYWLHTVFLALLFCGGAALFQDSWWAGPGNRYTLGYFAGGVGTALAIVLSNLLAPGGMAVGSILAVSLSTVGWLQASR